MDDFAAVVIDKEGEGQSVTLTRLPESRLMAGDVTLRLTHSTLNYKDGLALTGRAPVVRTWPMIPGIDGAGIVESSQHPDWAPGDRVILNGWGAGETHLGCYAERARVPGDWLVPLPDSLNPAEAMAVGTAGYTAMLSLMALERHGLKPEAGPAVVTGAAGGVGSMAVCLLAAAGWHIIAATGRRQEAPYLRDLGAAEVIARDELAAGSGRPLQRERWAAGIDCVGGQVLASVLAATRRDGAIAACGLAGGAELPAHVAPFILRGVSLLGIDSVQAKLDLRRQAWTRLARDLDRGRLAAMTTTVRLAEVLRLAPEILAGKVRGRVVVEIG